MYVLVRTRIERRNSSEQSHSRQLVREKNSKLPGGENEIVKVVEDASERKMYGTLERWQI